MVAKVTELLKKQKWWRYLVKRQLAEYQDKLSELDEIEEDIIIEKAMQRQEIYKYLT